ncbi:HEAT repeat domain-containing protein [Bremerella sp. P1]|uniref:HEAT repeat domain-containing protein n=1 Tax=Bremerella sp. P1 TaxID=3026424 RepID=UPI002367D956|nr:HEAT repeat domain-containing protein [Bremerella sp. P1]WDI40245.1 HEAT repeat domain-containing protein [Bremerella sp. P1]
MFVHYLRNHSIHAALLAAIVTMALATGPGCRSVVDGSRDLTELASTPPKEKPEKPPRSSAKLPAETDPAVEAAEVVLAASVVQTSETALRPQHVQSRGWYLDHGVPVYQAVAQRSTRWRHSALESLLDQPESPQATLENGTKSNNPEIAATALIGLVRGGYAVESRRLAELIEDPEVAFTTKAALLEALAMTSPKQAKPIVEKLFQEKEAIIGVAEATDEVVALALEQQFWISLAMVLPVDQQASVLIDNFSQVAPPLQGTLLDLLMFHRSTEPDAITEHFDQLSPQAIRRLGLWEPYLRSVASLETLIAQTRSPEFASRANATIGLGRDGSAAAQAMLKEITDKDPTLVQVAAVFAWSLIPGHEEWSRLSEASSWRVRLAVAELVPLQSKYQAVFARLKEDNSRQVREAMIQRSPELVAQQKRSPEVLPRAAKPKEIPTLSAEEVVAILDLIEKAEHASGETERTDARRALLLKPEAVLAAVDQAAEPLVSYNNPYLFDVLLPQCDPAYRHLQEATSGDPKLTLSALRKLEQQSRQADLPELVVWRLQSHVEQFTPMTWPVLMEVIRSDQREAAQQIVRRALAHDNPQVRIAAYRYIADFPLEDVSSQVQDGLRHEMPNVRVAAIEALASVNGPASIDDFVGRLTDSDIDVQMAACRALDAQGDPRGLDHLSRMTYSSSKSIRLKAVQAIASRKQAGDIPLLIRVMDDETAIRSAALDGLSSIVPKDQWPGAISDAISLEAKCAAWKNWFDRQAGQSQREILSPSG